jgi:hypothetical protein
MTIRGSLNTAATILLLLFSMRVPAIGAEFGATGPYRVGLGPSAVAVGDFDGDGKLDVVVANLKSNGVTVLFGRGDGTFGHGKDYRVGTAPQAVAVGDFNGDGKPDLAVANSGDNSVSLLFGNGDGTFRRAPTCQAGAGPRSLAVGDFNNDGKLDLAVANAGDSTVSVFLSNGDETFRAAQNYRVSGSPQSVVLADFNTDGNPDLAVANSGSNAVDILVGQGDGSFQSGAHYTIGRNPYSLTAGDFDSDGQSDLAVTTRDGKNLSVLLASGGGAFHAAVGYVVGTKAQGVVAGDFNGDGKIGLAIVNPDQNSISMLLGQADGTMILGPAFSVGAGPSAIAVGDFNGDGAPDLVVANATDNDVTVLMNLPVAKLSPGSLTFGVRAVGSQSAATPVTLANTGSAPLMVGSIRLAGPQARDFAETSTCPLTPFTLAAHQTCTLNATFTPTAGGTRKASLLVTDNALGSPHAVTLSGGDPAASTVWKGGVGNWSDPAKWTNGVPTSALDALIDNGNPAASPVTLDIGGQANNLTIDSDDSLSFNNGTSLAINGATISNAGTISLNSAGSLTTLFVATAATLTGAGAVTMSNNSENQVDGNGGAIFTNKSTIQGVGMIGPHFTLANQGTINANVSGAILALGEGNAIGYTNTATLEATNGGILQINTGGPGSLNNTGGTIKAIGANSQVQFPGSGNNITGGTLTSSSGGTIVQTAGSTTLTSVTNSGTFQIQNGAFVNPSGTLINNGTLQINSGGSLTGLNLSTASATLTGNGTVVLNNNPASIIDGNGGLTFTNQSTIQGGGAIGPHVTFMNKGTLSVPAASTLNINGPFVNFSGTTLRGGKYLVTGTLQFTGANIITSAANLTLSGTASQIIDQNGGNGLAKFAANAAAGSFTLAGNRNFTTAAAFRNSGNMKISAGSVFTLAPAKGYTQNGGSTIVDGNLKAGLINIQAGSVFGTNTLRGNVQSSGTITPGDSSTQTGLLAITGNYTQNPAGSFNISIGGLTAGSQYAQLNVARAATLGGTLNLTLINGFVPNIGDTFKVLNASSVSGTFATINSLCINSDEQFAVTYEATDVLLTVVAGACT